MKIKNKSLWLYAIIQVPLLVLWATGVFERSALNLLLVTMPTWLPYLLVLPLKIVEVVLRKKIKNKQKNIKDVQKRI